MHRRPYLEFTDGKKRIWVASKVKEVKGIENGLEVASRECFASLKSTGSNEPEFFTFTQEWRLDSPPAFVLLASYFVQNISCYTCIVDILNSTPIQETTESFFQAHEQIYIHWLCNECQLHL